MEFKLSLFDQTVYRYRAAKCLKRISLALPGAIDIRMCNAGSRAASSALPAKGSTGTMPSSAIVPVLP
jgi:hypothetical protein